MSVVLDIQPSEDYEPSDNEIVEYGKWLGMTFPEDLPFLWIAREGLKAPLPEHWKACKSEKGELYYFNFKTGESIWDHPLDEHYKELYRREKENPTPQSVLNGAKRQHIESQKGKSSGSQKIVPQKQKNVKCLQEEVNSYNATLDNKNKGRVATNCSKQTNLQVKNNNTVLNEVIVKREIPHDLRLDVVNETTPKVKLSSHISKETNLSRQNIKEEKIYKKLTEFSSSRKFSEKQSQNLESVSNKHVNNNSIKPNKNYPNQICNEYVNDKYHSTFNSESGVITVGGVQCLKRLSKRSLSNEVEGELQSTQINMLSEQKSEVIQQSGKNVKMSAELINSDDEQHAQEQQALLTKLMEEQIEKFGETFMREKEETFAKCFAILSEELEIMCDEMKSETLQLNSFIKQQIAEVKVTSTINKCERLKQILDDTMQEVAKLIKEKEECLEDALCASDVEMQRHNKCWQEQCESARKMITSSTEELFEHYTKQFESFLQYHAETIKVFCSTAKRSVEEEQSQNKYFQQTTCEGENSPLTKCCCYGDGDGNSYEKQYENTQNLCSRDAESLTCRVEEDCKESPSSSMGNTATTTTSRMATRLTTTTTASSATTTRDSLENEFSINFNSCETCHSYKGQKVIESEHHCAYCNHMPKLWEQTESKINGNITFANNDKKKDNLYSIEKSSNWEHWRHNSNVIKTRAHSMPPKLDADVLECEAKNRKFDIFSAEIGSEQHVRKLFEEFLKETLRYLPLALKAITSSPVASTSPCYATSEKITDKAAKYEHEIIKKLLCANAEDNDNKEICAPSIHNFCNSKDTNEEQKKESRHLKKVGTANASDFTTTESTPFSSLTPRSESKQEAKHMMWLEEKLPSSKLESSSSKEVEEKREKDLVNQKSFDNHKTKIVGGKAESLCNGLISLVIDDIIKSKDDLDNQCSARTECQSENDVLFLEKITREKWKRLQYRREQLHFAKRIWKLDMIEAKRCDVRSTSKRGQELKARQVKIEKEMEVIYSDQEILTKILNELAIMNKENKIPEIHAKITYNSNNEERFANEVFTNKQIKQMKDKQEREEELYNQYSAAATKADGVKECVNICNYKNDVYSKKSKNNDKIANFSISRKENLVYKHKKHDTEVNKLVKLMEMFKDSKFTKENEGELEGVDRNMELSYASKLLWNFLCKLACRVHDVKENQSNNCSNSVEENFALRGMPNRHALSCQHTSRKKNFINKEWNPLSEKFISHKHKCKREVSCCGKVL